MVSRLKAFVFIALLSIFCVASGTDWLHDKQSFDNINTFGFNPDVDTSSLPEDLWRASAVYVFPPSAAVLRLVSDSANDTLAGTGARTAEILGLDANYMLQSETVNMAGLTQVLTTNLYLRHCKNRGVYRAFLF